MSKSLESIEDKYEKDYDEIVAVGELFSKGYSPAQIAGELGIKPSEATKRIMQFRGMMKSLARDNVNLAEKASMVFEEVEYHWNLILKDAWRNKERAEEEGMLGTVNQSLKLIADIQKERARLFKELGAGQDADVIAQLEEAHRNQEILVGILREAVKKYPDAAKFIQDELTKVTNEAEVIEVVKT